MWLQVLVEQSLLGWKEFELEVMRDTKDNVVIICSIENVDPMGVHTGDSITIAPAQTLTDKEYQRLRDAAVAIIREMGVETGECHQPSEVSHQTTVIRHPSSDVNQQTQWADLLTYMMCTVHAADLILQKAVQLAFPLDRLLQLLVKLYW